MAHLSCSSVITELRYGAQPRARAHYWQTRGQPIKHPVEVDLSNSTAHQALSQYIAQKGDRSDQFPFKKVEINWPSDWLNVCENF